MILNIFFSVPTTWLQQVSFLYGAAVHTAAGLLSCVFWGTWRAARAIQCAPPGSPSFNPHPAPPPGTCTSSCAASEPPCFVGFCVRSVWPLSGTSTSSSRPSSSSVRRFRAALFFLLCVLDVAPVRYFYIISSSLNSRASSSSALGAPARFLPPTGLSLSVCMTTFPSRQVLIL